ncbi:brain acid soluble protein 1 homolog [Pocillopora damicornis]|uniref:brain acid soluble protein 1 homolog n=1 Tax=Pocillopora damicornis TaxID=46731 RepID=UPI000F555412|nr:brain acid soluble protein 1 homolog [Pocillopora damicornis]
MIKIVLLFVCLALTEGRNIQRFAREESGNTTATDLKDVTGSADDAPEVSEFQADLVAPASGPKPLEAKYTIRVKPKLKDGVPQIQEIRIMPPRSNSTKEYAKPIMVLKQNITKPLIENIEIDVPEKGVKYSSKPSVEVIEGNHKERMRVTKGEAVVESAAQKSETNSKDEQDKPQDQVASQNTTQTSKKVSKPSASQNSTSPSTSQDASDKTTSQNATYSATSKDAPQKLSSKDATETNAASSPQTSAAPPSAPSADHTAPQDQAPASDSSSSQKEPQQPPSQDSTASTQTPAAPQSTPGLSQNAPQQSPSKDSAASTQTPAAPRKTPSADQAVPQTQSPAQAVQAAPAASAYSQPAPVVSAPPAPAPAAYYSAPQTCSDHSVCRIYPDDRCRETWLQTNCRLKCRLCSK